MLLYHSVCPAKYGRVVFTEEVDLILKEVCLEIAKRYEIIFLEQCTAGQNVLPSEPVRGDVLNGVPPDGNTPGCSL
jgi:hypothetical protein